MRRQKTDRVLPGGRRDGRTMLAVAVFTNAVQALGVGHVGCMVASKWMIASGWQVQRGGMLIDGIQPSASTDPDGLRVPSGVAWFMCLDCMHVDRSCLHTTSPTARWWGWCCTEAP